MFFSTFLGKLGTVRKMTLREFKSPFKGKQNEEGDGSKSVNVSGLCTQLVCPTNSLTTPIGIAHPYRFLVA